MDWNLTDLACTSAMSFTPTEFYEHEEGHGGILDKEKFYQTNEAAVNYKQLIQTADYPQLGSSTISGADPPMPSYGQPDDVTLTVGANDIDFVQWLGECFDVPLYGIGSDLSAPACNTPENDQAIESEIAEAKANLDSVLQEMRDRAVTAGKWPHVYLTGYYDPLPDSYPGTWNALTKQWVSSCPDIDIPGTLNVAALTPDEMTWIQNKRADLNSAIYNESTKYSNFVTYVDITNIMKPNHTFCSTDPWVFGPSIATIDLLSPAPFHPTPAGQYAIERAIEAAINK
jgi:lysophospholipase L1-like esterase